MRYLFSEDTKNFEDDEILIILTPRIVRLPDWTRANLRPLYSGSETNVQVKRENDVRGPSQQLPQGPGTPPTAAAPPAANPAQGGQSAQLRFEPRSLSLKVGQQATIGVVVDNVNDLFSIPFLVQYNPAVISVEEVQHGGFLQGGNQEIAIVTNVNKEHGQAIISATRQPNTHRRQRHRHDHGHCGEGACPRHVESVDRAGKCEGLAAEGRFRWSPARQRCKFSRSLIREQMSRRKRFRPEECRRKRG